MKLNYNTDLHNVLINHIITIIVFFAIYNVLQSYDKSCFSGTNGCWIDMLYFTTTTHSTTGYGDIVPTNKLSKIVVSIHQLIIIALMMELIFIFVH